MTEVYGVRGLASPDPLLGAFPCGAGVVPVFFVLHCF